MEGTTVMTVNRRSLLTQASAAVVCAGVSSSPFRAFARGTQKQVEHRIGTAIVFACDVSSSVKEPSYNLQRHGLAEAFRNPGVLGILESGFAIGNDVLASVVEWSDFNIQHQVIGWTLLDSVLAALAFADAIDGDWKRSSNDMTSIIGAVRYCTGLFSAIPYKPERKVIDISGDGINNNGGGALELRDARARADAADIVINGLPILNSDAPNLAAYYEDEVIVGPGKFSMPAIGFETFAEAMVRKLSMEVA